MPGMPFNQTFSFPHQLTLRTTPDGIRLFAEPIQEIVLLHEAKHVLEGKQLISDRPAELDVAGALFDIRASFEIGSAGEVGLDIGGNPVTYDVAANKLNGAELYPIDGKLSMQILVDRPMIEISGNAGRVVITSPRSKLGDVRRITAFAKGGDARLLNLEVHELKSIWDTKD